MNKYRNVRSGGRASKRENRRATDLRLMEKLGLITDLREQVKYELLPKQEGERAVTYTLDFQYKDLRDGKMHYEDSKGFKTQQYVLRRKMMLYFHKIRIEEV